VPDPAVAERVPRQASAVVMLSLPPVAAGIAAVCFGAAFGLTAARLAAIAAAASAVLMGWPVVFWLLDHGNIRLRSFAISGLVLGALPLVATLVSGASGVFIRSGELGAVSALLEHGAPIPGFGLLSWSMFLRIELLSVVVGVTSCLVHWALFVRTTSLRLA
jgi:hypothetical protein